MTELVEFTPAERLDMAAASIAAAWKAEGMTHVLVYSLGEEFLRKGADPYEPEDWEALRELTEDQLTLVENFGDAYRLYRLGDSQ